MYARGCTAQLDASAKPPCFTHSAILSLSRARACAAFYRCNVTPVVTLRSFRTMTRWCQESFLARVLVAALLISLLHPTQAHAVPEYEPSKTPDHDDDGGRSLLGPVAPSNHGTYPCGCATCRGTRCWVVRVVRKHRERGRIDRCAACRCVARESDLARVACSWGPLVLASFLGDLVETTGDGGDCDDDMVVVGRLAMTMAAGAAAEATGSSMNGPSAGGATSLMLSRERISSLRESSAADNATERLLPSAAKYDICH